MLRKLLPLATSLLLSLAGACTSTAVHAQPVPAQWNYSFQNGTAVAIYPGNTSIAGSSTIPTLVVPVSLTGNNVLALSIPQTYLSLNANQQGLYSNVGGCLAADYPGNGINFTTGAIVGCVSSVAGSYSGTPTWPDAGLIGLAVSNNAGKAAVGLYSNAGATVSNAYIYGANNSVVNCRLWNSCAPGSGLDYTTMYGLEVDSNVYSKSGSVAPSGRASGIVSQLNSDVGSTVPGVLDAFNVVGDSGHSTHFKIGYNQEDGASVTGIHLGSQGFSGTAASQTLEFNTLVSSASRISTLQSDTTGLLKITGFAGDQLNLTNIVANAAGNLPPTCGGTGFAMTDNYISGSAEGDFINCATGGAGFAWYQMTSSVAATQVLRIDGGGNMTTPAVITVGAYLLLHKTTVASLPACGAGLEGALYSVSDANSATFNAALAGGGANHMIAFCNGTSWTVH